MFRRAYAYSRSSDDDVPASAWQEPEPPSVRWTLREYLRLLMQGKYHMIGEAPPRFGRIDHQEQAERIYRKARLPPGCDPRWLCQEWQLEHSPGALPPGAREVYYKGRIIYQTRWGEGMWGLLVTHGLVHFVEEITWCGEWTHSDIWHCSIEASLPRAWLREVGLERAREKARFVPVWFIEDRWDAITGQL
jgi:hypothetical protein